MNRTRALACAALVAVAAPHAAAAGKDAKKACFDAYPEAQRLRKAGKLRDAEKQLVICSQDACPAAVRKDCAQWLADLANEMPTVVLAATDERGDVTDVRVSIDGELVASALDGKALRVDPGEHTVVLEHGGKKIEQKIVVREGEKYRKVQVSFAPAPAPKEAPPPPVASTTEGKPAAPETPTERPVPVTVWIFGGVGVASLAAAGAFYFSQKSEHDRLATSCAPRCSPDDVSGLKTKQLLSEITLGVGVASLGAAAVLYFTRPARDDSPKVGFAPLPGGGAFSVGGGF